MKNYLKLTLLLLALYSCNTTELEERIAELEAELEECQNGASKTYGKLLVALKDSNITDFEKEFINLEYNHPESIEYSKASRINDSIKTYNEKLQEQIQLAKEKEKRIQQEALLKLKHKVDDIRNIHFYYNPYFTHYDNTNKTSIYLGKRDGSAPYLILKMSYSGDDWIFFDKAYLSFDGNTMEIPFNKYEDKNTENSSGEVWEWIQVSITDSQRAYLVKFAESPNAKMRLAGKYTKDRVLSKKERNAIIDVLNGYEALLEEKSN